MGLANRDYMRASSRPLFSAAGTPATWWIIGLNVLLWVFAAGSLRSREAFGTFVYNDLTLIPQEVIRGQIWRLFTAIWVHSPAFSHVLFNMFGLFVFGRIVESRIGTRRYVRLYLLAGLASTVFLVLFWLVTRNQIVAYGASGALYGVATWLATTEPQRTFLFFGVVPVPAWLLVGGLMVGGEVMGLGDRGRAMEPILGHLAGAVVGFALAKLGNPFAASLPKSRKRAEPTSQRTSRGRRGPRRSTPHPSVADDQTRERVDALLNKISEEGIGSLSAEEKQFLEEASRRFR